MKRALIALAAILLAGSADAAGYVTPTPMKVSSLQVANNTTAVQICSGPCVFYGAYLQNNSATIAYVKLYNATSATCGSGTVKDRLMIPANSSGAGAVTLPASGVYYDTGLIACITTGYADNDTTAPAASAYLVSFFYNPL